MLFREVITIRSVFVLCMFAFGLSTGFWYHINKKPTEESEKVLVEVEHSSVEQKPRVTIIEGIRIPQYEQGVLKSLIFAEKATWVKGEDVKLVKPRLYEFGSDGITVTSLVKGDYGFITIDDVTKALKSFRMSGNVSLKRTGLNEPKKD